ncbi:MAG: sulfite exporter TauE/SafE family protein [Pseudomonadota bacterium]
MSPATLVFLNSAVFLASCLQAATGIGFGLIGGPALLTQVAVSDALIATGILSVGIAVGLIRNVVADISWPDLKRLCLGGVIGLPAGAIALVLANAAGLKTAAAIVVGLSLLMLFARPRQAATVQPGLGYAAGVLCGVLGVCLSMPGPVAAAYLLREGRAKAATRATILAFFLPAHAATIPIQLLLTGPTAFNGMIVVWLAPATAIGLIAGRMLSTRLSERAFRILLQAVLAATIASLLVSAYGDLS